MSTANIPTTRTTRSLSRIPRDWWLIPAGAALGLLSLWGCVSSIAESGAL